VSTVLPERGLAEKVDSRFIHEIIPARQHLRARLLVGKRIQSVIDCFKEPAYI